VDYAGVLPNLRRGRDTGCSFLYILVTPFTFHLFQNLQLWTNSVEGVRVGEGAAL
ncbi:hypothetical protein MPER_15564, partial [Moniliophthora perniciosa FA553]